MKDIDATIEEMEFYGRAVRDKWRGISLRSEHCWDCKFSNAREDDPEDDDKCKHCRYAENIPDEVARLNGWK